MKWWLVAPLLTLAMLVLLPILALVAGASMESILDTLRDPEVLQATATSVGCAIAAVILGLVLGVPTAFLLSQSDNTGTRFLRALFDLPVVIPHHVVGIGLLLLFGRRQLVGAALDEHFGVRVASAMPGIILAMLIVSCPLIIRFAYEGFRAIPASMHATAQSLGASSARRFFTVALPLATPSVRSGALMAWARAVSEFGSVVVLAYYPQTSPVLIWDRLSAGGIQAAVGPALLLIAVCLIIFVLMQFLEPASPPA